MIANILKSHYSFAQINGGTNKTKRKESQQKTENCGEPWLTISKVMAYRKRERERT